LADIESGKQFKPGLGVKPFDFKSKEDAIAWMNLTIGAIYYVGQKNQQAALPYLYKATMAPAISDVSKNPTPYELIGIYYFDQIGKLVDQIKAKQADQKDSDTPEVAKQKLDEYNALVAMLNGTAERAMDAYARAYTLGAKPEYKAKMKASVHDAYKVRFGKETGIDEWIASATKKPFVDPATPIQPIADPTPAAGAAKPGEPEKKPAAATPSRATPKAQPAQPAPMDKSAGSAKPMAKKTTVKKKGA